MKKIQFYTCCILLFISGLHVQGQDSMRNQIRIDQKEVMRENDSIKILMNLYVNKLDMGSQDMISFIPILKSADRTFTRTFPPVIITGNKREKAINRAINFDDFKFEESPYSVTKYNNNQEQVIPLEIKTNYEDWMFDADLDMIEKKNGCNCDLLMEDQFNVISPLFHAPRFRLTYITPQVDSVKRISETHAARLNFEVNKFKLLHDYKNNAQILMEVDKIIREIQNDSNLTVTNFAIVGYASPEGNPESNMKLSENRAYAFVNYLQERYNIPPSSIKIDWKGEDWEGLRKVVAESDITDKNQIIEILGEDNVFQRKRRLEQFNSGQTYRMLLRDYYPPLRRNEYTISYIARNFTIEESRELIKTKPHHLSQNEMFRLANSYPKNSKEFKEVFDIISRVYPNNPVTELNAATYDLENGDNNKAIEKLLKVNSPEAWNNLGIAYSNLRDYKKAEEFFRRAANAGLEDAKYNQTQLTQIYYTSY
ncbi:MAG: DUF3868 domain-containing protein [Bacteroidales bacterium]|nr:DUF3868 domain-containing protein [Bacteroidales bacterium]